MRETITIRHRRLGNAPHPAFSARTFRDLSGGGLTGETAPEGYADTPVPVSGETLAQCVYVSGLLVAPALCSGLGRCGLCRVRFISEAPPVQEAEKNVLSHHDLDNGWRLACRHAPKAGMHILTPALPVETEASSQPGPAHPGPSQPAPSQNGARAGFAVDLGTTSVYWRQVSLEAGTSREPINGDMTNPQMGAGSDVISRLAFAAREGGAEALRGLIVNALARAARSVSGQCPHLEEACIAANPAMTAILLGKSTAGLAAAPYTLEYAGNAVETIPGLPPVYIPPLVSPFIGGDVSAGYASLVFDPEREAPRFPFLLADLGTNGECVLALSPTNALAASLPMGPALEGINLAFGSQAVPGVVTGYALTPYGLEPEVMGGGMSGGMLGGITGTGYLSLLRSLRAAGVIDETGLFARPGEAPPLARKMGETAGEENGEPRLRLPGKMALFASDIEEILKVKAAFTVAVSSLLKAANLPAANLAAVYLAGALGSHAPLAALFDLGFLPPAASGKVVAIGNASLDGAALFLTHHAAREKTSAWARAVTTLNLADDPDFGNLFAEHMLFRWRG